MFTTSHENNNNDNSNSNNNNDKTEITITLMYGWLGGNHVPIAVVIVEAANNFSVVIACQQWLQVVIPILFPTRLRRSEKPWMSTYLPVV